MVRLFTPYRMERQYKLLGALTIEEDGRSAPVMKSNKGCALLAALIIRGKPLGRETLADRFGSLGDNRPIFNSPAHFGIQSAQVGAGASSQSQAAILSSTPDTSVDLAFLRQALEAEDVTQLNEGLALYEGDLLDSFYLNDAPRFDEWLLLERENLRRKVIGTYRRLCIFYADQKAWSQGIDVAQRWLALDEFDEEALRFLMQLLAASEPDWRCSTAV